MVTFRIGVFGAALMVGGCGAGPNGQSFEYKVTTDGAAVVSDRQTYESLGDQLFKKTQKYQIAVQGDGPKPFHLLVVNYTRKIGDKVVESSKGVSLPMSDGHFTLECVHNYDQKLSKSVEDSPDPTCEIEPIGVIVPNATAKLSAAVAKR